MAENEKPGSTLWQWWLDPSIVGRATDTDKRIKGYASATSVSKGNSLTFYVTVNPAPQQFRIKFYRMGWYQGQGGRYLDITPWTNGVSQPACPVDAQTGMVSCSNWTPSYTLQVPTTWVSGFFLAVLINANGYANYVPFVVRDDSRQADILYQAAFTTYEAYNNFGAPPSS